MYVSLFTLYILTTNKKSRLFFDEWGGGYYSNLQSVNKIHLEQEQGV